MAQRIPSAFAFADLLLLDERDMKVTLHTGESPSPPDAPAVDEAGYSTGAFTAATWNAVGPDE